MTSAAHSLGDPTAPLRGLTLVLGGARSGKSTFAENLAARAECPVLYVATAAAGDEEMQRRIKEHRQRRPTNWRTLEVQRSVAASIVTARQPDEVVLLEDLTLLAANYLMDDEHRASEAGVAEALESDVNGEIDRLCDLPPPVILVSNEVGMGLVPPYPLGRVFRDLLGRVNQRVAARADAVYLLVAGIPLVIKGG